MAKRGQITADASAAQARRNAPYFKKLLQGSHSHGGSHGTDAIREVDYKGHHIVIKTTYRITIDGKLFKGELGVTNDGMVHYHGMPSAGFDSAVDLVKSVIDSFPAEFGGSAGEDHDGHGGHDHGGHDHGGPGEHAGHGRAPRRKAAKSSTRRSR